MGAAQSKKRRKERKRKKKMQISDFDMPRSASADVIRTLSVSTTSCPLCQQLSRGRTFYNSLESSHHHSCLIGRSAELSSREDGFESCPSCSDSTYYLTGSFQRPDMERSTMSLNRNFGGRTSRLVQSKSSEFAELLDILKDCETQRGGRLSPRSAIPQEQARQNGDTATIVSVASSAETMTTTATSTKTSSAPSATNTETHKKVISILEDEESRNARWERQKLMAQQLRTLRKHIQQQEAVGASENVLLPFPDLSLPKDFNRSSFSGSLSDPCPDTKETANSSDTTKTDSKESGSPCRRSLRSKFSKRSNYRYLDNHPALSKLQNEQNNRLESMERRMREIRISAMQEAERRKFAEIFPAKDDNTETEKRLKEARETLEKLKAEKKRKKEQQQIQIKVQSPNAISDSTFSDTHDRDSRDEEDSGDIIPVHIVPQQGDKFKYKGVYSSQQIARLSKSCDKETKRNELVHRSHWLNEAWPNINLGNPFIWLLLPFLMFPLILRILVSLIINTPSTTNNGGASSNSSNSNNVGSSTTTCNTRATPCTSHSIDTRQKKP